MWMTQLLQNVDLSSDSFDVCLLFDPVLFHGFYGDWLRGLDMNPQGNLTEGSFTNGSFYLKEFS